MAIIYSYPLNDNIKPLDELVGTTEHNINGQLKTVTRNFLLSDLAEFFIVDGGIQKTITLTTSGSSGPATLNQLTGVLNIPQYSGGGGSQNLQQVTDVGSTTTNSITANSFIKTGGSGSNVLLDNGTTLALSSIIGSQNLQQVLDIGNTTDTSIIMNIANTQGVLINLSEYSVGFVVSTVGGADLSYPLIFTNEYAVYFQVDNGGNLLSLGSLEAYSFVKSGGLSTEYLMADGSVTTGGGGSTNLGYTPSPTNGIVTSSTGTDATIPLADTTNAGLLTPAEKTKISNSVPYTGATANVDLGTHSITVKDLIVNHSSGSGDAATITKGGSGEALKVVKTSGSGNAASITGGVTLLDELHLNTDLADTYIASASVWNAKQNALGFTPANDLSVVHLSGTETITGFKTFTGGIDVSLPGNAVRANSGQAIALDVIGGNNANAIAKFTRVSDSVEVARIDNNGLKLQLQTINTIAGIDANKSVVSLPTATYPSLVELTYAKGVTSAIQTQLDNKIAKNIATTYTTNAITTVTAAEYAAIGTKDPNTLYFII